MEASEKMNPGRLMGISGSYWMTCTLHAAVKLDVFSAIGNAGKSAASLADELGAEPGGLARLLNALCAMDLLEKNGDIYTNTPESRTFLVKDAPRYVGYMIMHHHHLVPSWTRLDEAVKTGNPVRTRASFDDEEVLESFLMGMFNNAMGLAPDLVNAVDLSGRKHLLDLGGGPGTYAIHFCMHNPGLNGTVFDLPTTGPFAEKIIARFNQQDAVDFIGGDFLTDTIPGTYDVAWLSHILHGENPGDCENIVRKAADALVPGGLLLIHEFILDDTRDAPLFPALFSLNMLLGTEGGRAYAQEELFAMLGSAGMADITRLAYKSPMESGIVSGTKPS